MTESVVSVRRSAFRNDCSCRRTSYGRKKYLENWI
jgi:hypothetical protein